MPRSKVGTNHARRPDDLCPACAAEELRAGPPVRDGVRRECAWYRRRTRDGVIVIFVLPRDLIDYEDVLCLVRSLTDRECLSGVVVNLSRLPTLNSGLLAGLLTLQKRVEGCGGKLALCGAKGLARGVMAQTRLDTLLAHYRCESDAVRTCRGGAIA